ncbi:histidine ammonia-lyase [Natronosalvus caseinilyticus]|uniref:histidine ammonia-lyase n=1 Tax=Natronosalvus caseinilyticus TaxID=2953747 RepID=UPI0028AF7FFE|nr:histidine ammonia-lyase [Natronosalvus caseinilyticus]
MTDDDSGPVELDGRSLTPEDVVAVARDGAPVTITTDARERVRVSRERVEDVIESGEPVYGLNTGFGELVDERIPPDQIERLQTNLLRSHAAGAGRECTREEVRAMMVSRVNALVAGYSGVREVVVDHLVTLLNEDVQPVVRSRGSLGASGDLAPLAHLSLVLIGEGEAILRDDEGPMRVDGEVALEAVGREPLSLAPKEGLALINGTQLTVGLAAMLVVDGERLLRAADAAGALTTEVTLGTTATSDAAIHDVRPHVGQQRSAAAVRALTADSDVVEAHRNCDRVQDAYSLRCLPQVHGAVRDAVAHLREAVTVELNSATDNPLVFSAEDADDRASGTDRAAVISGGNFHGQPLALRLEYARLALTDLGAIAERRIDRILNPNLQEDHLPPFLAPESGLQSGYMIAQYTAAALLNECRSIGAASSDNTPVSGGQEDHVSMSSQSALNARRVLENVRRIVATEAVCATQAADYVGNAEDVDVLAPTADRAATAAALGNGTGALYEHVGQFVPPLEDDRVLDGELDAVADAIASGGIDSVVVPVLEAGDEQ